MPAPLTPYTRPNTHSPLVRNVLRRPVRLGSQPRITHQSIATSVDPSGLIIQRLAHFRQLFC